MAKRQIPRSEKSSGPPAAQGFSDKKPGSPVIICLLLGIVTCFAYFAVVRNGFVVYDDGDYVSANPHVEAGLTPASIAWAFTTGHASNWHPLTWLSHMLDCQFFGRNPAEQHLVNLALHIANTLLLFLVLRRMTEAHWRSALVAALFALHPLHVESVAWLSERKDVLSTLFLLLTIGAYVEYVKGGVRKAEDRGQRTENRRPAFAQMLRPAKQKSEVGGRRSEVGRLNVLTS